MSVAAQVLLGLAVFSALVSKRVLSSPNSPGRVAFALSGLTALLWISTVALRLSVEDLEAKIRLSEYAWFAIIATPLFWASGFLDYAGYSYFGKKRNLVLVGLISLAVLAVAITNDAHHALYTGITNYQRPSFSHGWFFYVTLALTYASMATALVAAVARLRTSSSLHRFQFLAIAAAMLMPWVANAAFLLFQFRVLNDDPTPFAFGLTALIMLLSQQRIQLFKAPPIARDAIFAVLPDPVIVLDANNLILEVNPAAQEIPGFQESPVGTILPADHAIADILSAQTGMRAPVVDFPEINRIYEATIVPLDQWGRRSCRMLVLRDVTARHTTQNKLAATTENLQTQLQENIELQIRLHKEATCDFMTGLYNRRYADQHLARSLEKASQTNQQAVIALDLDHFKAVNDERGHAAGDEVLCAFAAAITSTLKGAGTAYRFGGEEFIIHMSDCTQSQAITYLKELHQTLDQMNFSCLDGKTVTFSAGIAMAPASGQTLEACTRAADTALYRAKLFGRNRDIVWNAHMTGQRSTGTNAQTTSKVA